MNFTKPTTEGTMMTRRAKHKRPVPLQTERTAGLTSGTIGEGESLTETRSDVVLADTAIRNGWNVPQEVRAKVLRFNEGVIDVASRKLESDSADKFDWAKIAQKSSDVILKADTIDNPIEANIRTGQVAAPLTEEDIKLWRLSVIQADEVDEDRNTHYIGI